MASIPIALQERIMMLAGLSEDRPPTPAVVANIAVEPVAVARSTLPSSSLPDKLVASRRPIQKLKPSDLFVLETESGPGFIVLDKFLSDDTAQAMAVEAASFPGLRASGMGRGFSRWADSSARSDSIAWLKPNVADSNHHPTEDANTRQGSSPARVAAGISTGLGNVTAEPNSDIESGGSERLGPALSAGLEAMRDLQRELVDAWGCGVVDGVVAASPPPAGLGLLRGHPLSHQLARYLGDGRGYARHRDAFPPHAFPPPPKVQTASTAPSSVPPPLSPASPSSLLVREETVDAGANDDKERREEKGKTSERTTGHATSGAGSQKHVCQVFSDPYRKLTAILYLNRNWTESAGGKLRLFMPPDGSGSEERHYDVAPLLNRLVVFRSDRVDHEVLPTFQQPRHALTSWFYGVTSVETVETTAVEAPSPTNDGDTSAATQASQTTLPSSPHASLPTPPPPSPSSSQLSPPLPASLQAAATEAAANVSAAATSRCGGRNHQETSNNPAFLTSPPLSHVSVLCADPDPRIRAAVLASRTPLTPLPPPPPLLPQQEEGASCSRGDSTSGEGDNQDVLHSPPHLAIFVSVCSFRDSECQHTLRDLFDTASHPERVFVGVVEQYKLGKSDAHGGDDGDDGDDSDGDDAHCFTAAPLPHNWASQVRSLCVPSRDAQGPCWARHWAQKLWRGEEFILQIDSHMRFRPNWDTYLTSCLAHCPSAKPVLTAYPPPYTLPSSSPCGEVAQRGLVSSEHRPTLLCPTEFGLDDGMLRQTGKLLRAVSSAPVPSLLWAGGFSFTRAKPLLLEAPYDPELPFLFFGEEISMAARLWTHGFDCFAPPETVLYHLWTRKHRPLQPATYQQHNATAAAAAAAAAGGAANCHRHDRRRQRRHERQAAAKSLSQRRVRRLLGIDESPFAKVTTAITNADGKSGSGEGSGGDGGGGASCHDDGDDDLTGNTGFDRFGKYGLGRVRSLASFEHSLGVCFNPAKNNESDGSFAGANELGSRPRVVDRGTAKWGGQPSERFNETDQTARNAAAVFAMLSQSQAMSK